MCTYEYSGQDFLESLEEAHHYNSSLIGLMKPYVRTGSALLDFGAGTGTFSKLWKESQFSISAVEPDPTLNAKLNARGIRAVSGIDALQTQDQFDLVYSLNVLEHIEDDFAIAQKLFEHVKPGGTLFIYVPAFQILYSDFDKKVGHFRRYSKSRLGKLGSSIKGGTVVKISYFDTLGFLLAFTFKMLGFKSDQVTAKKILFFDRWIFPFNQILDPVFGNWFGKNLYVAVKKSDY
jgi:SAM-dependent methyltransferase